MLMCCTISYYFNTILIYKFSVGLNPWITLSITGKVVLTITPLEWLVAMHIIFDKNTGGKTSKFKWLFASNSILSILKALQSWISTQFAPGLQLQRQLNYTKCLVSDVISSAQNRALKKRKMDSNHRYFPGHIMKGVKKIWQTIDPIHF